MPAASTASRSLLERHILRPHPRPTEIESAFPQDHQVIVCTLTFEKLCAKEPNKCSVLEFWTLFIFCQGNTSWPNLKKWAPLRVLHNPLSLGPDELPRYWGADAHHVAEWVIPGEQFPLLGNGPLEKVIAL